MPKGGARAGAGRKKKPLADKIANKNPGHRPLKKIEFADIPEIKGEDMPPPSEWLTAATKNTARNVAPMIYEQTWRWLAERKCDQLITREQIEQYALNIARWVQCEDGINQFGLLAKHPTTNMPISSPYVSMGSTFLKQANAIWAQIFQVVKENCETPVGKNPNEDIMELILTGKI